MTVATITDSLSRFQQDSVQANLGYTHNFAAKGEVERVTRYHQEAGEQGRAA